MLVLGLAIFCLTVGLTLGLGFGDDNPSLFVHDITDGESHKEFVRLFKHHDVFSKEIANSGTLYDDCRLNPYMSVTATSHICLFTGAIPADNRAPKLEYIDRFTGEIKNIFYREGVKSVFGESTTENENSPGIIIGTTVYDEFLEQNPLSKVVVISTKNRAVLAAGHKNIMPFWQNVGCDWVQHPGEFMTTDYYMDQLPQWATDFNVEMKSRLDAGPIVWNLEKPLDEYLGKDNERLLTQGGGTWDSVDPEVSVFPKIWEGTDYCRGCCAEGCSCNDVSYQTALWSWYGDKMTYEFAMAAIDGEQLGQRVDEDGKKITDILVISASGYDLTAHGNGRLDLETEDTFLKKDKAFEDMLNYADSLGIGMTGFSTSDHGFDTYPEENALHGYDFAARTSHIFGEDCYFPGPYYPKPAELAVCESETFAHEINEAVKVRFGIDYDVIQYVPAYYGFWTVTYPGISQHDITFVPEIQNDVILPAVEAFVADKVAQHTLFSAAVARTDIMRGYVKDQSFTDGFHPDVSGNVLFKVDQFVYHWPMFTGRGLIASHGSNWAYDNQVPCFWWGKGIKKQVIRRTVYQDSFAPTLAAFLGISRPSGSKGEQLYEVLEDKKPF